MCVSFSHLRMRGSTCALILSRWLKSLAGEQSGRSCEAADSGSARKRDAEEIFRVFAKPESSPVLLIHFLDSCRLNVNRLRFQLLRGFFSETGLALSKRLNHSIHLHRVAFFDVLDWLAGVSPDF
jgi:hypothetical protein